MYLPGKNMMGSLSLSLSLSRSLALSVTLSYLQFRFLSVYLFKKNSQERRHGKNASVCLCFTLHTLFWSKNRRRNSGREIEASEDEYTHTHTQTRTQFSVPLFAFCTKPRRIHTRIFCVCAWLVGSPSSRFFLLLSLFLSLRTLFLSLLHSE